MSAAHEPNAKTQAQIDAASAAPSSADSSLSLNASSNLNTSSSDTSSDASTSVSTRIASSLDAPEPHDVLHHVRKFIAHTDPVATRPKHRGLRVVRYARRLSDAYSTHQCSLMACACAYCAVLSLIPLIIVGVAVLGFVLGSREHALNDTIGAIRAYVPVNFDFLKANLESVLENRRVIGIFGLTFLIYGAHQTFLAMQPPMNMIWVVPETRHWFKQRLIALGATFFTLILLPADIAASVLTVRVADYGGHWISNPFLASLFKGITGLPPILITTLLFAVLYRILPDRRVPWKSAFVGAGVAAFVWQLTKLGFVFYLQHSHGYQILYGSLYSIVVLVVWVYYTMALMLLGAEITADHEFMRHGREAAEERSRSGADLTSAARDASASRISLPADRVGMNELKMEESEAEKIEAQKTQSEKTEDTRQKP